MATCFVVCSYPLPRLIALAKGDFICVQSAYCMHAQKRGTHRYVHTYEYTQ